MGVAEVILPTNDMGNFHLNVVDHVDKVEDGTAIFSADDEIRLHRPVKSDLPTNQIFHNTWSFRHFEL